MNNYFNLKEGEEIEIELGDSFNPKSKNFFHNVRFDFKPASIDQKKMATVDVTENQAVELTFPHKDEGKETKFKGTSKKISKECVLICDNATGKWTLETISTLTPAKYIRIGDTNPVEKVSPQPTQNNKISPQNKSKIGTTPVINSSSKQHAVQHQESKLSADSDVDDANDDDISNEILKNLNGSDSESSDSSDSDSSSSSSSDNEQQFSNVSNTNNGIHQNPVPAPVTSSNSQSNLLDDLYMSSDDSD